MSWKIGNSNVLEKMNRKRRILILLLIFIVAVLYALAIAFDLYLKTAFIDLLQHFIAGLVLALIWAEINGSKQVRVVSMSIIGFVLLGSLTWELLEFSFLHLFPTYSTVLYLTSYSVEDTLTDLLAALIGGTMIAIISYKKYNPYNS